MRRLVGERTGERRIVDLRDRLVERLEQRLEKLVQHHRTVVAAAYENVAGTQQVHRAVLALIEPPDLSSFLYRLTHEVPRTLGLDDARLCIESDVEFAGPAESMGADLHGRVLALPEGTVADYMALDGAGSGPVVLREAGAEAELVFGEANPIQSEALMRLDLAGSAGCSPSARPMQGSSIPATAPTCWSSSAPPSSGCWSSACPRTTADAARGRGARRTDRRAERRAARPRCTLPPDDPSVRRRDRLARTLACACRGGPRPGGQHGRGLSPGRSQLSRLHGRTYRRADGPRDAGRRHHHRPARLDGGTTTRGAVGAVAGARALGSARLLCLARSDAWRALRRHPRRPHAEGGAAPAPAGRRARRPPADPCHRASTPSPGSPSGTSPP